MACRTVYRDRHGQRARVRPGIARALLVPWAPPRDRFASAAGCACTQELSADGSRAGCLPLSAGAVLRTASGDDAADSHHRSEWCFEGSFLEQTEPTHTEDDVVLHLFHSRRLRSDSGKVSAPRHVATPIMTPPFVQLTRAILGLMQDSIFNSHIVRLLYSSFHSFSNEELLGPTSNNLPCDTSRRSPDASL